MKNIKIKDLNNFMEISYEFDTPLKLFSAEDISKKQTRIEAIMFMKTFVISWTGEIDISSLQETKDKLEEVGFINGKIEEEAKKFQFIES